MRLPARRRRIIIRLSRQSRLVITRLAAMSQKHNYAHLTRWIGAADHVFDLEALLLQLNFSV